MYTLIIGTRGSDLAIKQTEIIQEAILKAHPDIHIEMRIIKTEGDRNMQPIPTESIGKGWFTKEIEEQLLKGAIDIAVHSLKDLPEILPRGLHIGAISKREDVRDVLISHQGATLNELPEGAVIGTDSIRRKIQIMRINPHVVVKSIRGNVNTRLQKLEEGEYDALVLAAAGMERLGFQNRISGYFSPESIVPAPGQGALAVEIRSDDAKAQELLAAVHDIPTFDAITAERAFAASIGGGCKFPIGAYATCHKEALTLKGFLGSFTGVALVTDTITGKRSQASDLGKRLAKRMLKEFSLHA